MEQDQPTRSLGGRCWAMSAPTPLTVPARGIEIKSTQRQSEDVGEGVDTTTCTPSMVGWGPPYSNYWFSLVNPTYLPSTLKLAI